MEPPQGRALDPLEKAQLKEKLALLKREYRRTFHRLQRAERAERVKTYVKRTVTEQNLLLQQEGKEKDHGESTISQAVLVTSESASLSPALSPAKTVSVTFKPDPKVLRQGDGCLPSTPVSKSTNWDCRKVLFGPAESLPQKTEAHLSRSATGAEQKVTLPLDQRDAGCQPEQKATTCLGGSQSPVFKRRSSSASEAVSVATADGSSCESTPFVLPAQETPAETPLPGNPHPYPCPLSCESRAPSDDHSCQESFCVNPKGSAVENALPEEDLRNEGKGTVQMEEDPDLGWFVDSDFEGRGITPGVPGDEEETLGEQPRALDVCKGDPASSKLRAKGLGELLGCGSPPQGDQTPPAMPAQKVLSSCTVVEGLLFPVEYYVRTTRRMSSHQTKVNLEAVIQSQLGRSRKEQKVMRKEKKSQPLVASQVAADGANQLDPPLSAPATSPSLQPSSESIGQWEGHLRPKRRGRPRGRARPQALSGSSQNLLGNSEVGDDSLLSSEVQGGEEEGSQGGKATETPGVADGCLKKDRKEPGEGRSQEAEFDLLLSPPVIPGAQPASGFTKAHKEDDREELVWEGIAPQQAESQSHDGTEVAEQDKASLPWEESGVPQGGRGHLRGSIFMPGAVSGPLLFVSQRSKAARLPWLPLSVPEHLEFCLPDDEFGLLKSEKCKACPVKEPESSVTEGLLCVGKAGLGGSVPGEGLSDIVSAAQEISSVSPLSPRLHRRGLSPSDLLLSLDLEGVSCPLTSPLPTPAFPMVGTTPASPGLLASQVFPEMFCASPWQAKVGEAGEASTLAGLSPSFPRSGTRRHQSQNQCGASWAAEEEMASLEERHFLAGESPECSSEPPKQDEGLAGRLPEAFLEDVPREGNLQMTSKLKSCSGSSSVDVGSVWWEAADFTALCVVTASETSVSLWRQLDTGHWAAVHTWHFSKVPVIQIVHLPEARNLVCVALGCLEIAEIQFLFYSSEESSAKQSLVKTGNIKAVLGLRKRRLVTSCIFPGDQEVEVISFSELGRSNKREALMSPEETVLAFAEVDGMQDALVGMTTTNCLLVWNVTSGQLLRKVSVGCSYHVSICHRAYSDSGLLFVVLSHPHAKENEAQGVPAFQVVALNPKTARSAVIILLSVPRGTGGRFLEGDVRGASAAAVLTSGTIAVWDLFLGCCTAMLPPNSEGNWSLVRWSVTDMCLLAGQNDGSVYIYSYTPGLCPA